MSKNGDRIILITDVKRTDLERSCWTPYCFSYYIMLCIYGLYYALFFPLNYALYLRIFFKVMSIYVTSSTESGEKISKKLFLDFFNYSLKKYLHSCGLDSRRRVLNFFRCFFFTSEDVPCVKIPFYRSTSYKAENEKYYCKYF